MRHKFRRFNGGLWLTQAEDEIPEGALRRNRGTHPLKTSSIRSRNGLASERAIDAHSITRFDDSWYYGTSTTFHKEAAAIKWGLNGDRLSMTPMPPAAGMADYLFVSGGGTLFKVAPNGVVTNWGIEAPDASSCTAVASGVKTKYIDNMEIDAGLAPTYDGCAERWSFPATSSSSNTSNTQSEGYGGSYGLQGRWLNFSRTDDAGCVQSVYDYHTVHGAALDLTTFSDASSSLESDFISFWLRLFSYSADASAGINAWDYFQIDFSIGVSDFSGTVYSRRLVIKDPSDVATSSVFSSTGDLVEYTTTESERWWMNVMTAGRQPKFGSTAVRAVRLKAQEARKKAEKFSAFAFSAQDQMWTQIKVAKNVFDKRGSPAGTPYDWANVWAIRFTAMTKPSIPANSTTYYQLDELRLEGGYGLQGDYQYAITFRNSTTGNRSNAGTDHPIVRDVARNAVVLSGIPTSADSQVDQREIWRTLGGGSLFWRVDVIENNTATTYTDTCPDPDQDLNPEHETVENLELPADNAVPDSTFDDCAYHLGAAFWIDRTTDTKRGNVYYSATGRPEANKGYIIVTCAEDPLQKLVRWNDALYVWSQGGIYRIDGSYPYTARKVYGCQGTTAPHTIAVSNYGVLYESDEGVRLFNGMSSQLVSHEAVSSIFRGEASEQLTAFTGVVATAGKEEYVVSDGAQTLALYIKDKTWRDVGLGLSALYYSPDEQKIMCTYSGATYQFEKEEVQIDAGVPIPFHVQTRTLLLDEEKDVLISRVHLDGNTNAETLAVSIIVNGVVTSLGNWTNALRGTTTISVGLYGQRVAVRLTGSLSAKIEVFGIEIDTNKPGEAR